MLKDETKAVESISGIYRTKQSMNDGMVIYRARGIVTHKRPYDFDNKKGTYLYKEVDEPEETYNLITNVGRIFIHTQSYGSSGLGVNGLNFIGLSNDLVTETATSTTLSNEITVNGLARAQGTVTLPTAAGVTTVVDKVFTATGTQSCQKAALFTAATGGVCSHIIGFTQRSLISLDTIEIQFSLTIS